MHSDHTCVCVCARGCSSPRVSPCEDVHSGVCPCVCTAAGWSASSRADSHVQPGTASLGSAGAEPRGGGVGEAYGGEPGASQPFITRLPC